MPGKNYLPSNVVCKPLHNLQATTGFEEPLIAAELNISEFQERFSLANSLSEIYLLIRQARHHFGICNFGGGGLFIKGDQPEAIYYCDGSRDFVNLYSSKIMLRDPLLLACMDRISPLSWSIDKDYRQFERRETIYLDVIEELNIGRFLLVPIADRHSILSVLRFVFTRQNNLSDDDMAYLAPKLTMLGLCIYENLKRLSVKHLMAKPLTKREQETLQWVSQGKTSWEISRILQISENTVLTYMKSIHKKLGVSTRQHAVAKAMTLGIIHVC